MMPSLAPLFWLSLGGPVGLWAYKTVSTADSMWGYHTPRWEYFGKAAARADDLLAFVPARLSALLLWLTAYGMERGHPFGTVAGMADSARSGPAHGKPERRLAHGCGGVDARSGHGRSDSVPRGG